MNSDNLIKKLRVQSTWSLVGLSIITLGIYGAYYIKKQTFTINSFVSDKDKLSHLFINAIIVLSYINVISSIATSIINNPIINDFNFFVAFTFHILYIVWGFKVRNRLNSYCHFNQSTANWFDGFWTFLFTSLYFNYHINCIHGRIQKEELE